MTRLPTLFISHGSPMPAQEVGEFGERMAAKLESNQRAALLDYRALALR